MLVCLLPVTAASADPCASDCEAAQSDGELDSDEHAVEERAAPACFACARQTIPRLDTAPEASSAKASPPSRADRRIV
jgi:hypothetical protein